MIRPNLVIRAKHNSTCEEHYFQPTDRDLQLIAERFDVDLDKLRKMMEPRRYESSVYLNMEEWRKAGNEAKKPEPKPILEMRGGFSGPVTLLTLADGKTELRMVFDANKSRVIVVPR